MMKIPLLKIWVLEEYMELWEKQTDSDNVLYPSTKLLHEHNTSSPCQYLVVKANEIQLLIRTDDGMLVNGT